MNGLIVSTLTNKNARERENTCVFLYILHKPCYNNSIFTTDLKMPSISEILDTIALDPSRNAKLLIIKSHSDNALLQRVVKLAYDPLTQFYIRAIPQYNTCLESHDKIDLSTALDRLQALSDRTVTGNAAATYLGVVLSSLQESDADVVKRIIAKDLRIGASASTFNKVWPGLVPDFPCMLCSAYDDKLLNKMPFPALAQRKEDGMRFNAIVRNGSVEFRSRNGKEISLCGFLESEFIVLSGGADVVFDGELLVYSATGEVCDRQTGNGILNQAIKNTILPEDAARVHAHVWDIIPLEHFQSGKFAVPYATRWDTLLAKSRHPLRKIHYVETQEVANRADAEAVFQRYLSNGAEGIILKARDGIWENKRSRSQIKFKGEFDCSLRVVACQPGTGKYAGLLGAIVCTTADEKLTVSVGSGFTDEQRRDFADGSLVGQIVSVKYNAKICNKTGEWSLFLPIFDNIRTDQDCADTFDSIQ